MSFSLYTGGASSTGIKTPENRGVWLVHPIVAGGIFANDPGLTNLQARYRIVAQNPLTGGAFSWRNGGGFTYTRGTQTGNAWFDYEIMNYDGKKNNTSARVTVIVQ